MPEVTANGVRLYYEERGSGDPILGLHGAGGSALATLTVPTLIVSAEDSLEAFQRATEELVRALPDARATRVDGGHAIDPAGPDVVTFVREILGA